MPDGPGLETKLTKKIGPLPAYMWGVILGGLILVYMWYTRNKANAATAAPTTTTVPTDTLSSTGLSAAGTSGTSTDTGSSTTSSLWSTNALWESQALTSLAGSGVSPLTAQVALENYLNGMPLTTQQQDIINTVLGKLGAPPNGLAGIPQLLAAPPDLTGGGGNGGNNGGSGGGSGSGSGTGSGGGSAPPVHGGTYVIKPNDNWITIANMFGVSEQDLLNLNADNPVRAAYGGALSAGETVWLPVGATQVQSSPGVPSPKPAPPKTRVVTINKGDNWNTIAARLGVTEAALRGHNPQLPGTLATGNFVFNIP